MSKDNSVTVSAANPVSLVWGMSCVTCGLTVVVWLQSCEGKQIREPSRWYYKKCIARDCEIFERRSKVVKRSAGKTRAAKGPRKRSGFSVPSRHQSPWRFLHAAGGTSRLKIADTCRPNKFTWLVLEIKSRGMMSSFTSDISGCVSTTVLYKVLVWSVLVAFFVNQPRNRCNRENSRDCEIFRE